MIIKITNKKETSITRQFSIEFAVKDKDEDVALKFEVVVTETYYKSSGSFLVKIREVRWLTKVPENMDDEDRIAGEIDRYLADHWMAIKEDIK